ncbi:high nitrogen upregulated cytochrome P450 monooxygenase 2 [Cubamyces lactineus]|nr:high nitrogen upregulated cytochrome P450 monooxygenase 2 [Cubamyces lactineus]
MDPRFSTERAVLAVCVLGLLTHQLFKRFETYSIPTHILLLLLPPLLGYSLLKHTMPTFQAALVSVATIFGTMFLSIAAYRLSPFHPLARYPGPLGCRLTKFWMAILSLSGRQHIYIQELHKQYGDVVRIGPNELSFRDASVSNAMYGPGGLPKGPIMVGRLLTATDLPLVGIMDPHVHAERRKPWNRAFSAAAVKEYEPLIASRATQLVQTLEKQSGEVVIGRFFNYFTYDFMCDMAFGGGSELLRDGDQNNIWHTMEAGWPAATFLSHVPYLGPYCGHLPFAAGVVERLLSYCRTHTLQRMKRGSECKDIFHYLNNEDQPDKPSPPLKRLLDEGVLAIVAGSDTTSSALTSLAFLLVAYPPVLRRLQQEIDQFYPPGEDPCDAKHYRDMHYLTAVIHETLRLYPPVPSGMHRMVPHRGPDATLGSYYVPAGTSMFLPPYTLHRDPRNFSPFTEEFWPERWLVAADRLSLADALSKAPIAGVKIYAESETPFVHNDAAFIPFSHGPANCVGKQLAMQEMRTVVCALLQKFDMRAREGWDVREYDRGFNDYFITTRPEVPVVLSARI